MPERTDVLWIDTTAVTGGLKYHNGSAWVSVPTSTGEEGSERKGRV